MKKQITYDMLILGKPMAQLKIAWSVTTTGVNAVISVIAEIGRASCRERV